MKLPTTLRAGLVDVAQTRIALVLVGLEFTDPGPGDELLTALHANFPLNPIMLVAVLPNGFRAHAAFQTATLLSLVQLDKIKFEMIEVGRKPPDESEPPF